MTFFVTPAEWNDLLALHAKRFEKDDKVSMSRVLLEAALEVARGVEVTINVADVANFRPKMREAARTYAAACVKEMLRRIDNGTVSDDGLDENVNDVLDAILLDLP